MATNLRIVSAHENSTNPITVKHQREAKLGKKDKANDVYMPLTDGALSWNEYYNCFMYVGYWDGRHIADGYNDDNRPHGATITLNNGRGTITWNKKTKQWERV